MSKHSRWLYTEVERWRSEGIVSESQAEAIRNLYPPPPPQRAWAAILFSGIGAVIVGLGVILLFAYNWDAIPKFGKLAVVFAFLATLHASGLFLFHRDGRFRPIGEALCVLGTMFFGAGIWLIAQIYHIDEHYPNAFLFWGLGALGMAWAMPSVFQGILASALFTIWAGCEAGQFETPKILALLLIGSLAPLAYRRKSRLLLIAVIIPFGISLAFLASCRAPGELVLTCIFGTAVALAAIGYLHRFLPKVEVFAPIYLVPALASYWFMVYLLTFKDIADEILELGKHTVDRFWIAGLAAPVLALAAWIAVGTQAALRGGGGNRRTAVPADRYLMPLSCLLLLVMSFFFPEGSEDAAATAFNLVFLAHAAATMAAGARDGDFGVAALGSVLLVFLVGARYVDLFDSLIARGIVFVIVGGVLFAEGILCTRARKRKGGEAA